MEKASPTARFLYLYGSKTCNRLSLLKPSPQGEGGPRTVDEVNPNANYNSHLAKRYSIGHLIRRLRRHLPPEGKAWK